MFRKPSLRVTWFSAAHALILSVLTLIWMNQSWEFSDEIIVARINQIARYEIFEITEPAVENFQTSLLCVNGSYDKALIPYEDDWGYGNQPVTDRKKLADLLSIIADAPQPPKLVVMDILFEGKSTYDNLLEAQLKRLDKLVISSKVKPNGELLRPWPGLNYALAQYATTSGKFLKYNIMDDTIHYLPAAMYQQTQSEKFREQLGLARSTSGWWHNSYIVDLPIRQTQLSENKVLVWNLGEALELYEREEIYSQIADKIIVFGDFYTYDSHETLLGEQPGPLIVANAYLSMIQGVPRLKFLDGVLIFLLYFVSSLYVLFWRPNRRKLYAFNLDRFWVGKFVMKYLSYLLIFSLYSIFLYLINSRHFQLLIFALYFNLFEYIMDRHVVYSKLKAKGQVVPEEKITTV